MSILIEVKTPRMVKAHWLLAWLMLCLGAGGSVAAEIAGVRLNDKVSVGGSDLTLNGAGVRTRAIFKVYVASLYTARKATTVAAVFEQTGPRRVQLNLLRKVSSDQLLDALNAGLTDNNSSAELDSLKAEIDTLSTIMREVSEFQEGDIIALDFFDDRTQVSRNGESGGTIPGVAFNRALLKVWLGEKPAQASLKSALLGG